MIAALSPAKNLDLTPSAIQLRVTQPAFMAEAESLMKTTRGLSQAKIRELMNLSQDLAKLNYDRYRSFELPFSEVNALPAALWPDVPARAPLPRRLPTPLQRGRGGGGACTRPYRGGDGKRPPPPRWGAL